MNRWQWLGAFMGLVRRLLGTSACPDVTTNVGTEQSVTTRAVTPRKKTTRKKAT